jgi:chaperonin cofactor prefoldin
MILPLLREIRADLKAGFDRVDRKLEQHDARFDKLERRFDNLREAVNGESVLGRYAAAQFEERLEAIEKRLAVLETGS